MSNLEDVQAFGNVHLSSIVYARLSTLTASHDAPYSIGFKTEATDLKREVAITVATDPPHAAKG